MMAIIILFISFLIGEAFVHFRIIQWGLIWLVHSEIVLELVLFLLPFLVMNIKELNRVWEWLSTLPHMELCSCVTNNHVLLP